LNKGIISQGQYERLKKGRAGRERMMVDKITFNVQLNNLTPNPGKYRKSLARIHHAYFFLGICVTFVIVAEHPF
jgi:hypothetical protein